MLFLYDYGSFEVFGFICSRFGLLLWMLGCWLGLGGVWLSVLPVWMYNSRGRVFVCW